MTQAPSIVVVRQGTTPIVNGGLASLVSSAFDGYAVRDIDVLAALRARPATAARLAVRALRERRWQIPRNRPDLKKLVLTSEAFGDFVRELVREQIDSTTRFVLQSQSLFDAGVDDVPLVVYTDHAHLANLGYPAFDRSTLLPAAAIRREAALYARANVILVRSTNIRDVLRHDYGVERSRIAVVGVGPNAPSPTSDRERSWNGGRIVFVGYDWERKGGPQLLEAFRAVTGQHPTARLEVVGVAAPDEIDVPPSVHFHGPQAPDGVAGILDDADVFCLPTLAEPFGVVFIEAMLAGLPVVGTDLGAQPDFIIGGKTGELVRPGDVDDLARALDRLLSDPSRTRRLGRSAGEFAREHYTWDVVMRRMRDAIEERLAEAADPATPAPKEHVTT